MHVLLNSSQPNFPKCWPNCRHFSMIARRHGSKQPSPGTQYVAAGCARAVPPLPFAQGPRHTLGFHADNEPPTHPQSARALARARCQRCRSAGRLLDSGALSSSRNAVSLDSIRLCSLGVPQKGVFLFVCVYIHMYMCSCLDSLTLCASEFCRVRPVADTRVHCGECHVKGPRRLKLASTHHPG